MVESRRTGIGRDRGREAEKNLPATSWSRAVGRASAATEAGRLEGLPRPLFGREPSKFFHVSDFDINMFSGRFMSKGTFLVFGKKLTVGHFGGLAEVLAYDFNLNDGPSRRAGTLTNIFH